MASHTRRMFNFNWITLIMAVVLSSFTLVKTSPAQTDLPLKLQAIAEQEINSEHETLITGTAASDTIEQHVRSSRLRQNIQDRLNLVQRQHELNRKNPHPYVKAETTLQPLKFEIGSTNATATLTAMESTKLYLDRDNDPETPEYTAYELQHTFTFVNEGGEWRLEDDQVFDARTLTSPVPPPTEVISISPSDPTPPEAFGHARQRIESPRSQDKLALIQPQTATSHNVYLSSIVNYAVTFYSKYNPQYHAYADDCTNFASQALAAGGWTNLTGFYQSNSVWWYTGVWPIYNSYTWSGANNLNQFLLHGNRAAMWTSVSSLVPGDILIANWNRDGVHFHTMIVTKKDSSGELYLTEHTNNALNKKFFGEILPQNPNTNWYAWDISRSFVQ